MEFLPVCQLPYGSLLPLVPRNITDGVSVRRVVDVMSTRLINNSQFKWGFLRHSRRAHQDLDFCWMEEPLLRSGMTHLRAYFAFSIVSIRAWRIKQFIYQLIIQILSIQYFFFMITKASWWLLEDCMLYFLRSFGGLGMEFNIYLIIEHLVPSWILQFFSTVLSTEDIQLFEDLKVIINSTTIPSTIMISTSTQHLLPLSIGGNSLWIYWWSPLPFGLFSMSGPCVKYERRLSDYLERTLKIGFVFMDLLFLYPLDFPRAVPWVEYDGNIVYDQDLCWQLWRCLAWN